MTYNPQKHHRRSIRMKGHDYAGGGVYFVTICAHRDWVAQCNGQPFHQPGIREMIGREWEALPERFPVGAGFMPAHEDECAHEGCPQGAHEGCPQGAHEGCQKGAYEGCQKGTHEGCQQGTHEGCPYVVMPDHFHGLISISGGVSLGEVIGAFKSLVVRAVTGAVKRGACARFPGKVWHRNYYEKIVRSEPEYAAYEKYIRLNPVRLVFELDGMAAFGNPALWEMKKIALLASGQEIPQKVPDLKSGWVWMSGFHSASEAAVLKLSSAPCIRVAAVGPDQVGLTSTETARLVDGKLLVLCPFQAERTTRENALKRNRLVAERSDRLWIPAVRKGGSLEKWRQVFAAKLIEMDGL